MKTLIIIPCYNEAENVETLYNEICEKTQCDTVFINDGSTDNTLDVLKQKKIPHINLPLNLGIGGAVQTGYRYALRNGYDIAVQLDGDGQHDPAYIDDIVKPVIQGKADIAIGSRFIDKTGFKSTAMRRAGIVYFRFIIKLLTGVTITDATSGFRACNRKVMELFANFYAKDYPEPESITLVLRNRLRVLEVPVIMRQRQAGESSISAMRSAYYMLKVSTGIIISVIKPRYHSNRGGK